MSTPLPSPTRETDFAEPPLHTAPPASSPALPPETLRFIGLVLGVLLLTFALLAPSLKVPFFTMDDSDTIRMAEAVRSRMAEGNPFYVFRADSHQYGRRHHPGYYLYQIARLALFDRSAVLWHMQHALCFALCGVALACASRRLVGSVWPGIATHFLVLSTGDYEYQSNWYNFMSLITFEPLLYFQWTLGAWCFFEQVRRPAGVASKAWATFGVLAFLWATITKETTPLIHLGFGTVFLALVCLAPRALGSPETIRRLRIPVGVVLAGSLAFLIRLALALPRDDGYAGTQSLIRDPQVWMESLSRYFSFWCAGSLYTISIGLGLGVARIIGGWRDRSTADTWLALMLLAGAGQLSTLVLWPGVSFRLSQPAYLAALFVACVEIARFLQTLTTPAEPAGGIAGGALGRLLARAALAGLVLYYLLGKRVLGPGAFVAGAKVLAVAGFATVLYLYARSRWQGTQLPRWGAIAGTALLAGNALWATLAIVLNLAVYPTWFRTTEQMRQYASLHIAENSAKGARAVWMVRPNLAGFVYSIGINGRVILNRPDLTHLPYCDFDPAKSGGPLRRGDHLVYWAMSGPDLQPAGKGRLSQRRLEIAELLPLYGSLPEVNNFLVRSLVPPFEEATNTRKSRIASAWVMVYTVESDTFTIDPVAGAKYAK